MAVDRGVFRVFQAERRRIFFTRAAYCAARAPPHDLRPKEVKAEDTPTCGLRLAGVLVGEEVLAKPSGDCRESKGQCWAFGVSPGLLQARASLARGPPRTNNRLLSFDPRWLAVVRTQTPRRLARNVAAAEICPLQPP